MDGKREEWEGWLNKKKDKKRLHLKKEDIPRTSVQLWEKKNQPESNDDEPANHIYALM